jgi:hypothetical protein
MCLNGSSLRTPPAAGRPGARPSVLRKDRQGAQNLGQERGDYAMRYMMMIPLSLIHAIHNR